MIPLYMDVDSQDHHVVANLRSRGFDVLTAHEAGRLLNTDEEQLEFATRSGRCIYSANSRDFYALHSSWMREGRDHSGIILRAHQRMPAAQQASAIVNVLEGRASLVNQLDWIR